MIYHLIMNRILINQLPDTTRFKTPKDLHTGVVSQSLHT